MRTRRGHGENDKLELYEDGEFGTRPGRTRYRPGIGPVTNEKKKQFCRGDFTACHLNQTEWARWAYPVLCDSAIIHVC